ncbi:GMC family oxidoreductase [Zavarzinia sp. CC-PAN008]|uniref:GMC family oxidoreductase n=1 Tax=Zavarzinia sp. CC-PAN008 TaxID=3243332 RepID=UPI003F7454DF
MTTGLAYGLVYDYVVVGGGSAGCALAARLSADPRHTVCLIEGGGSDANPRIQVPAGIVTLYNSAVYDYQFKSVPQARLNNRVITLNRGRVLGGCSSVNSMIYIRGHPNDYDEWVELGCPGWGWADVLPYFKSTERNLLGQNPDLHGFSGELVVSQPRDPSRFSQMFVQAAIGQGQTSNRDFNGVEQEGVGVYDVTQHNGQRYSAYRAFLHPVKDRPNLTIMTETQALALTMEGSRVTGIAVRQAGGDREVVARREVILAAGAIGSPHILLASGIGPAAELQAAGVTVRHDLPGVGKNLQEHINAIVTVQAHGHDTVGISWGNLPKVIAAPFEYLWKRKGFFTTNYVEAGGFARTRYANQIPDIQYHFVPSIRSHRGRTFEFGHGYSINVCVLRPKSIGSMWLDKSGELAIDYNFLEHEEDARVLIEGVKSARQILASPIFDNYRGTEMLPGAHVQTDEQIMEFIRQTASTVFHPVGTAKMGTDPMAVVTPELKVVGLEGLRVADASVMPKLIGGNTNAPSIMIGARAADFILKAA